MSLRDQIFQEYLRKLETDEIIQSDIVSGLDEMWTSLEGITKEKLFELLEATMDDEDQVD